MALNAYLQHFDVDSGDNDSDSLVSLEEDDSEYPIERILAQISDRQGRTWYLTKWLNCPLVRSSWESASILSGIPSIFSDWQAEKQKHADGLSKPFDLVAFNKLQASVEIAERQKRALRRLKKKYTGVLIALGVT